MKNHQIEMRLIQRKVCLLGEYAVGKTSMVRQFVEGRFDDRYLSTIGVKISRKHMHWLDQPYNLIIWDLADGDTYRDATNYLRGAAGAVVVCDITRQQTLSAVFTYTAYLRASLPSVSIVVAVNKADLQAQQAIDESDLRRMGSELAVPWLKTSAKTGLGVEMAFTNLVQLMESALT
ncbi:MAG: GTP-binding protein [Anaerolineales bacterium]|nr:GTP-binding protein [Anaerolineales bacterium]MCB8951700.1 GTP-binding protein [Ardenticatenales bacterium]